MCHFLFQGSSKYTKIGIFGMKIYVPSGNTAVNCLSANCLQSLSSLAQLSLPYPQNGDE
jgi:hypothetical protein